MLIGDRGDENRKQAISEQDNSKQITSYMSDSS